MENLTTWKNYSNFAESRGTLVLNILQKHTAIKNKKILDFGCGTGGTAYVFAQQCATVTAIDITDNFAYNNEPIYFKIMSTNNLQFNNEEFDIVILQDVLEHLPAVNRVLSEIRRVLKKNGIFFLSTPNRLSPLNFVCDPHWGLPFVSVLPRQGVAFLVKHVFRRDNRKRDDWAALVSLFRLKKLFENNGFKFEFKNVEAAKMLFKNPASVVCSSFHLKIVSYLKKAAAERLVYHLVNDEVGLFNYFINPTWYVVGKKV